MAKKLNLWGIVASQSKTAKVLPKSTPKNNMLKGKSKSKSKADMQECQCMHK